MGLPQIDVSFLEKGVSAIKRGERGIVALILEDKVNLGEKALTLKEEVPKELSEFNKEQINIALKGYINKPKKVIVYVVEKNAEKTDYIKAQKYLESVKFDYLAIPEIKENKVEEIANWIKELRDNKNKKVKAVLPNCSANHEGIINFTEKEIVTKDKKYTTKEYCSRIAGLLAGTPLHISSTFAPLLEVISCDNKNKEELDKAIDKGELVLYNDGEVVKIARGVNSLITTIEGKGEAYKKIKIIEAMDLITDDITKEIENNYIGKYPNSYDNKCLLIVSITNYLDELEKSNIIQKGNTKIEIDIEEHIKYLKLKGYKTPDGKDVEDMTELELKKANTGDKVFLKGNIKILDAIESVYLPISI